MRFQLDLTKEYGIVLEGGGARGSYQIYAVLFVCSHLPVFILIKYNYFSVLSAAISAIDFVRPAIP